MASSPRGIPIPSSPRSSTHFRIGVSPASSNESFARRGSEELLFGKFGQLSSTKNFTEFQRGFSLGPGNILTFFLAEKLLHSSGI